MQTLKWLLEITYNGQPSPAEPFRRCGQGTHQTPDSSPERDHNGFQYKPPQDPHKDNCNIPVADGASPQAAQYKQIKYDKIGKNKQKLKTAEFDDPFQLRQNLKDIDPFKTGMT
jgi:hypothetical protein